MGAMKFKLGDIILDVDEDGFTVWDSKEKQWLLDASTITESNFFMVAVNKNRDVLRVVKTSDNGDTVEFECRRTSRAVGRVPLLRHGVEILE